MARGSIIMKRKKGIVFNHSWLASEYWRQVENQGYMFDTERGVDKYGERFDDLKQSIDDLYSVRYITERQRDALLKKLERGILKSIKVLED